MSAIIVRVFPNPISSAEKEKAKSESLSPQESPPLPEKKPLVDLSPCCAAAAGPGTILSDLNKSLILTCTKRNSSPCSSLSRSKTFTMTFAKLKAYYLDLILMCALYCYLPNVFTAVSVW